MQKGFIQFQIIFAVLVALTIVGFAINQPKSNKTEIITQEAPSTSKAAEDENKTLVPNNTILCNGTNYTQCPNDQKFVCPKTDAAYCEAIIKNKSVSVTSNTLICNGKEWSPCSQGQNFYCPAQGDAQCVPQNLISTQLTQQELQYANNNKNNFIQRFDVQLKDYRDFRDTQSDEISVMNQKLVELSNYTGSIIELKIKLTQQRRDRLIRGLNAFNQLITVKEQQKWEYQNYNIEIYLNNNFENILQDGGIFLNNTKAQFEQDRATYYNYISK